MKRSGATTWVAVDGGMSDNPRPALYGARYSALVANRADVAATGAYAVCGKHCESGDVLIERAELAEPDARRSARCPGDRRVLALDGVELQRGSAALRPSSSNAAGRPSSRLRRRP